MNVSDRLKLLISLKLPKLLLSGFLLLTSWLLVAAEMPAKPVVKTGAPSLQSGQVVEIVMALAAILLLIAGIAWFFKRFAGIGPQGSQHIKTIAVMPLGTRERIAVIQIGERQIVVGITPSQITTLLELDQPLDIPPSGGEFARKLQSLLHGDENDAKGEVNGVKKQT